MMTRGAVVGWASAYLTNNFCATISSPTSRSVVIPFAKKSGMSSSAVIWRLFKTWTRCTWPSIKPGIRYFPSAASTWAPAGGTNFSPAGTIAVMTSPSITIAPTGTMRPVAVSNICPPRITVIAPSAQTVTISQRQYPTTQAALCVAQ